MASEKSEYGEEAAAALAGEVRALRALLEEVQAELKPAVQSSLRERSSELQRQGAELDEHRAQAERLGRALGAVEARAAELEREAARWKDAATRGLDEITGKVRAQAALFEDQTRELNHALTAARSELIATQADASSAAEALGASRRQVQSLEADAAQRERLRLEMMRSPSWRITAPLRWLSAALLRLQKRGAHLRRRLLKR
jgi:O-antigen chain-terminating methyltransferase